MKTPSLLLVVLTCCMVCNACYYDKQDALNPIANFTNPCDSTATYTQAVQFIMAENCTSCHSSSNSSGGIALDTYDNVLQIAKNGRLLGTIENKIGYIPMPPSTKMSSCQIDKLTQWVNNQEPH